MNHTEIKALEKIASEYHLNTNVPDKFIEDLIQDYCCDWLKQFISSNDEVIELGYGEGITVSRLSQLCVKYTLIEGAPSLAKIAKDKFPKIEVITTLFEDYLPSKPYDKILALHVLEHVDNPVSLLKLLSKWLKPNGEIIVIVPNKDSLHRKIAHEMGLIPELDTLSERDILVGHQRVYNYSELSDDLIKAGFEILELKGFFIKTLPNSMMLTHSPELIRALNTLSDELPIGLQANIGIRARVVN